MKYAPIILSLIVGSDAYSSVLTYSYEGVIDTLNSNTNNILGPLAVGETVRGSFSFDPTQRPGGGSFAGVMSLELSSLDVEIDSSLIFVRARDNVSRSGFGIVDRFSYGFDSNGPTTELFPLYVFGYSIQFIDTLATLYDEDPLLPVELNLDDYDVATWSFFGSDIDSRTMPFSIGGSITSISLVPEPSVSFTLVVALFLVSIRDRRRG